MATILAQDFAVSSSQQYHHFRFKYLCQSRFFAFFQFQFISAFPTVLLKTGIISKVEENFHKNSASLPRYLCEIPPAHFFYWLLNSFHQNRLRQRAIFSQPPHLCLTNDLANFSVLVKQQQQCLTLSGCSWGARSLSLFLHLSIRVNLPVFPVAWASAYTTSWNREEYLVKVVSFWTKMYNGFLVQRSFSNGLFRFCDH